LYVEPKDPENCTCYFQEKETDTEMRFALEVKNLSNKYKPHIPKADKDGKVKFRGFKGKYLISWKDKSGKDQRLAFNLE